MGCVYSQNGTRLLRHHLFFFFFLLDQREKVEKRKDDPTVAPTAFLWAAYYPNRYYYEVRHRLLQLLFRGKRTLLRD